MVNHNKRPLWKKKARNKKNAYFSLHGEIFIPVLEGPPFLLGDTKGCCDLYLGEESPRGKAICLNFCNPNGNSCWHHHAMVILLWLEDCSVVAVVLETQKR